MRQLVILLAFLVSCYVFVWGVTWLTGDVSRAINMIRDGDVTVIYPGVLFGGLPPNPLAHSLNVPFFASALGTVALLASGVILWRSLRGRNSNRG